MAYFNLQVFAADGHLNFDTKINEKGFSIGLGKLGGIAKAVLRFLAPPLAESLPHSAACPKPL